MGRVVAAREVTPTNQDHYPYVVATLVVIETIKGDAVVESTREVKFGRPCGVDVVISSAYVIFEHDVGATSRCAGTTRLTGEDRRKDQEFVDSVKKAARSLGGI